MANRCLYTRDDSPGVEHTNRSKIKLIMRPTIQPTNHLQSIQTKPSQVSMHHQSWQIKCIHLNKKSVNYKDYSNIATTTVYATVPESRHSRFYTLLVCRCRICNSDRSTGRHRRRGVLVRLEWKGLVSIQVHTMMNRTAPPLALICCICTLQSNWSGWRNNFCDFRGTSLETLLPGTSLMATIQLQ